MIQQIDEEMKRTSTKDTYMYIYEPELRDEVWA